MAGFGLGGMTRTTADARYSLATHAHPSAYLASDNALLGTNYDPMGVAITATALPKGQILSTVIRRISGTVANVHLYVNTVGATLTAGQNLVGVWSTAGVLLGRSADQSGNWTSTGPKSIPITAEPGQSLTQMDVIVGVLLNGTTAPSFVRNISAVGVLVNIGQTAPALRSGITSATGLTALPDPIGTVTDGTVNVWFGVS